MKIALCKFGKSILFGSKSPKGMTSGSEDAPIIYESLIKNNPQHTFYLLGRSDWARLKPEVKDRINIHNNVVDMWDGIKEWKKNYTGEDPVAVSIDYIDNFLKTVDLKLDVGVFLPGHMAHLGVHGKSVNAKGDRLCRCLISSASYAGPQYHYVNETNLPYVMLLTDPRVYPRGNRDLFVAPKLVLSQYNETLEVEHRTRYDSSATIKEAVESIYSGIESLYLVNHKEKVDIGFDEDRDISQMILFLNEGNPSRYEDVKEYVLNDNFDSKIYGMWKDEILETDSRFEKIPMKELGDTIAKMKYTFAIPIKKGWATGKFWDMIKKGIIPFVHPEYDSQKNIGFPEFLRVKNSDDLKEKVQFLEDNPKAYKKLKTQLQDMITEDKVNGKFLNDTIMKSVNEVLNGKYN